MSAPKTAPIPVYFSSFTPVEKMPRRYGAFIAWEVGQRVEVRHGSSPPTLGTVMSETKWHDAAAEIDGARGRGRWVREVLCDDSGALEAVSEDRLYFAPGTKEDA